MESPGIASTAVDFILIYAPKKRLIRLNTDESKAMVDAKISKKKQKFQWQRLCGNSADHHDLFKLQLQGIGVFLGNLGS